jgi:ESCRT-II complex subunit VPS22
MLLPSFLNLRMTTHPKHQYTIHTTSIHPYLQHQHDIQTDPVFRQRFLAMCAPLGIDPLASKRGFFAGFLGMGDYYHQLAVQVAEVCLASRSRNGGIMSIVQVQTLLAQRTTKLGGRNASSGNHAAGKLTTVADLTVAVQKLAKLGGGFRLVQVGESMMVISVPTELDQDHMRVMEVAASSSHGELARATMYEVQDVTGWSVERTERVLELLLQQGMAWVDEHKGETYYWFPSVWQERNNEEQL